jgi:DNA-directed RNA polymerase subunit M/transcription elongation factor TFIIS
VPLTTARTGVCPKCDAKYTHVLTLQTVHADEAPNLAPFSCPTCRRDGTLDCQPGHRIVKVETRLYVS